MSAPLPGVAVEALLRRMNGSPNQDRVLGLAGELGHLLAERTLTSGDARAVRLSFLEMEKQAQAQDVLAQLNVFVKMLSAYELSRQSDEQDAESMRGLDAEAQRILRALSAEPSTAAQLAGGKDNGSIGRRLKVLEQRGLVESVPASDSRKRTRVLTALGHAVAMRFVKMPAELSQPNPLLNRLLSLCVQSTLRALKAVRLSPISNLMLRAEVQASFAPELVAHGVVESFEYFGESFGSFDIDESGRFWNTDQNKHAERWKDLFGRLQDAEVCRQLFAQAGTEHVTLLTVSSRLDPWREVMANQSLLIEIETVESWRSIYSGSVRPPGTIVVDDSTLAENVAKTEKRASQTIELDRGKLRLRTSFPAAASAP